MMEVKAESHGLGSGSLMRDEKDSPMDNSFLPSTLSEAIPSAPSLHRRRSGPDMDDDNQDFLRRNRRQIDESPQDALNLTNQTVPTIDSIPSALSECSSLTSATSSKGWSCLRCFHTNGDSHNPTCALCGCKRQNMDGSVSSLSTSSHEHPRKYLSMPATLQESTLVPVSPKRRSTSLTLDESPRHRDYLSPIPPPLSSRSLTPTLKPFSPSVQSSYSPNPSLDIFLEKNKSKGRFNSASSMSSKSTLRISNLHQFPRRPIHEVIEELPDINHDGALAAPSPFDRDDDEASNTRTSKNSSLRSSFSSWVERSPSPGSPQPNLNFQNQVITELASSVGGSDVFELTSDGDSSRGLAHTHVFHAPVRTSSSMTQLAQLTEQAQAIHSSSIKPYDIPRARVFTTKARLWILLSTCLCITAVLLLALVIAILASNIFQNPQETHAIQPTPSPMKDSVPLMSRTPTKVPTPSPTNVPTSTNSRPPLSFSGDTPSLRTSLPTTNSTFGNLEQIGNTILGMEENGFSGISLSLVSDGSVVAFGGQNKGAVRVYQFEGQWSQLGEDLPGDDELINSTKSVALSGSANVITVAFVPQGLVRTYEYDATAEGKWLRKGEDIQTRSMREHALAISDDGSIVTIGYFGDGVRSDTTVRVYRFHGNWTRIDEDFADRYVANASKLSVDMSSNGSSLALASWSQRDYHVVVFTLTSDSGWELRGQDLILVDGVSSLMHEPSVSIDGTGEVVGACIDGKCKRYTLNSTGMWSHGFEANGDEIIISKDGRHTVVRDAPISRGKNSSIQVYQLYFDEWIPVGEDTVPQGDRLISTVAVSGNHIALGRPSLDSARTNSGSVEIYRLDDIQE